MIMWQPRFHRVALAAGLLMLLMASLVSLAWAYAEEPITFRDPYTGQIAQEGEVSTIHSDLTYVLALAAGFSEADSRTLMIWNQLVDSNQITVNDTSFNNCTGSFPDPPNEEEVCENTTGELFWPNWDDPSWGELPPSDPGTSCVTSRYGPFEGFFHFPHRGGPDMIALREWGWGTSQELVGYLGYVWGPCNISTGFYGATCFYTQTVTIDTGMAPGSLEAFATYLHSLADSYSHERCQEKTEERGWAWPTHTFPYAPDPLNIYECNYAPLPYLIDIGDSHHGREFGTGWPDDSVDRTKQAIRAVYDELQARSSDGLGIYQPLDLDTRLTGRFHKLTLDEALDYYVEHWYFDEPHPRRNYADQLADMILARRIPVD
jgi:hypothetical protein